MIPEEIDASFEITAYAILTQGKVEMPLEGVQYNKLFPSTYGMGGTYKVTNLLPGREYKIKVRLIFQTIVSIPCRYFNHNFLYSFLGIY